MKRLENKVAVVTGAAAGIGEATAKLFAAEGARVVVADRNGEGAKAVAKAIGEAAIAVAVDVRVDADVMAMIAETKRAFGRLDVLVNNAGKGLIGTVVTIAESDWDDIIASNLKSVYLCSKHAIPLLRAGGGGTIVNVASNVAQVGIRDRAAYVAAKGGVASLTRAMALDHAERQHTRERGGAGRDLVELLRAHAGNRARSRRVRRGAEGARTNGTPGSAG